MILTSHPAFRRYVTLVTESVEQCLNEKLWEVKVKVKVTLRLTVSQSVSLGIEHPPGAHDQILIAPRLLRSSLCGAPSLTRGWICLLYRLLVPASAVFLES
jgi:hypothetical protein